jgi:hypothetical protein
VATIGTSTIADSLAAPTSAPVVRSTVAGATNIYYAAIRTAADTLSIYRSTDSAATWAAWSSFTHTGLQEWSSIVVDSFGYLHVGYRIGTGVYDQLWYRRLNLNTNAWSGGTSLTGQDANAASIGSRWQGVDLAVVRMADATYAIAVVGGYADTTPRYGMYVCGVFITAGGTISSANTLIQSYRSWTTSGSAPGRIGVACELEHNGDGVTSGAGYTPNVWISFGRTKLQVVKLAWKGAGNGWQGPSAATTIASPTPAMDYQVGRWTGREWLMACQSPDDSTDVRVYQRNQANTVTTTFDTPTHPTGAIKNCSVSYDATTKNIRVYAVGTSTNVLYYIDYNRLAGTWSSWASVVATAVLTGTEWGVGRGGNSAASRHNVVTGASGSPNTYTHTQQATSAAPNTATWNTTGQAYTNGSAANVGAALPLAWNFSDIDSGDTQGSYALSRQIGAGALAYWNATSSTWVASEVQNTSATAGLSLASAWGIDGDPAHQYKVKVWDSAGVVAPGYSQALTLYPSAQVNPTYTAPASGGTIATDTVTISWTVAEQTGARIILVTGGVTVYDSGPMIGYTTASFVPPIKLPNGNTYTITLYTYNNDKLPSAAQNRNFSVAYAPPAGVLSTFVASPTLGIITVTPVALAAVGTQPTTLNQDLYRRVRRFTSVVSNGSIVGNVTGWTGTGGTLTYSTTQSFSAPGSARLVPTGAADAYVQTTTPILTNGQTTWEASAWIRPDTALKTIKIQLFFYDVSNALLATITNTMVPTAVAWHYIAVVGDLTAVTGAVKVGMGIGLTGTPAGSDAFYADELVLRGTSSDLGIRLATALPVATAYPDWGPASGVDYEYRWLAQGSNGTSQFGPWIG